MASLHAQNINKPIDPQKPETLAHPETGDAHSAEHAVNALYAAVDASNEHPDVQKGIHAQMHKLFGNSLVQRFIPGLENLANKYHVGNFVLMRGTGEKFFESMPLYPR
jgi:phosphatidylserine decarboxylase